MKLNDDFLLSDAQWGTDNYKMYCVETNFNNIYKVYIL